MRRVVASLLGMAVILVAVQGAAQQQPVKIGLLAPLSGIAATWGKALVETTTIAVEYVNDHGGILGRRVELFVKDDKTDPPAAVDGAKKLLQMEKVDALIGTIASHTTQAIIPLVQRARKPFFYVIQGEDKACYKYVFGLGPTLDQTVEPFIPIMLAELGKTYYFVGSDFIFSRMVNALTVAQLKKHGAKVIGEEYVAFGTSDYSTVITRIEAAKPDVLFTSVVGSDGIAFMKQAYQFGLKQKMRITGNPTFEPGSGDVIGEGAEGALVLEVYINSLDNPLNREFLKRYKEKYNLKGTVIAGASEAFAAVLAIKAAAEKAGTLQSEKVTRALEGLTFDSPQGQLTINKETHLTTQHVYLVKLEAGNYKIVRDLGAIVPNLKNETALGLTPCAKKRTGR